MNKLCLIGSDFPALQHCKGRVWDAVPPLLRVHDQLVANIGPRIPLRIGMPVLCRPDFI